MIEGLPSLRTRRWWRRPQRRRSVGSLRRRIRRSVGGTRVTVRGLKVLWFRNSCYIPTFLLIESPTARNGVALASNRRYISSHHDDECRMAALLINSSKQSYDAVTDHLEYPFVLRHEDKWGVFPASGGRARDQGLIGPRTPSPRVFMNPKTNPLSSMPVASMVWLTRRDAARAASSGNPTRLPRPNHMLLAVCAGRCP